MSEGTDDWPVVPERYAEAEGPVLVDEWWRWSVFKAFVMSVFIGLGAVVWGLGAPGVGQLLILLGLIWYVVSPNVQGPIA